MRRAFSAAAASYDSAAEAQREIARRLTRVVLQAPPPRSGRILEVGCGTGLLTRPLAEALPGRRWLITDVALPMLERCREELDGRPELSFCAMDGEHPALARASFDLIVSSFAMQWFDDLPAALRRLAALLRPGGRLLFAIPGAGTFREWSDCLAREGVPSGIGRYPTAAELAGFAHLLSESHLPLQFEDGHAFLRHLKAIGAQVAEEGYQPMEPGHLRRVLRSFDGRVSYHVLVSELRR